MKQLVVFFGMYIFVAIQSAAALAVPKEAAGLEIFSAITFVSQEGEYSGLQIAIIPYGYGESKMLWRSATGGLDEPILLDVEVQGSALIVLVPPSSDLAGTWTLVRSGSVIIASGPRGLRFTLNRLTIH